MKRFEIEELGWPENLQTAINNGIAWKEEYITLPTDPDVVESKMKEFLTDREFDIMMARYKEYKALLQIGKERGLSYERVRQIVDKARKELRILFSRVQFDFLRSKDTDIHEMPLPLYFLRIKDQSRALRIAASAILRTNRRGGLMIVLKPVARKGLFKTETYPIETVGDLIILIRNGLVTQIRGIAEGSRQILIDQLVKDGIDISELIGRDEK